MSERYDVIVVGLGAMGSAAAHQLARRGVRVLGLERHGPAHSLGSSHGQSRIIRQAYFEDPAYVPLLLRAYELWRDLERASGHELLTITGGLMIGPPESVTVAGARRSAELHQLEHELLDAAALRRRFPQLRPRPQDVALYEAAAGFLRPEACITTQLQLAVAHGAALHFGEPVLEWSARDGSTQVRTARGTYEAGRLILAPGAWAPLLLADLGLPLVVERQVLYWFSPRESGDFVPGRFPIFIWELSEPRQLYGFPLAGGAPAGVKAAFFRAGSPCDPETIDRDVHPDEVAEISAAIAACIPDLDGPPLATATCMYTTTPDEHFVIAPHPRHPQVIVASPCSGHGFKFASVIGEILADLALDGATSHPIDLFDPRRFLI